MLVDTSVCGAILRLAMGRVRLESNGFAASASLACSPCTWGVCVVRTVLFSAGGERREIHSSLHAGFA